MSRTIKFRSIEFRSSQFVIGNLVKEMNGTAWISRHFHSGEWESVEPKTIGQFTGVRDKNGVEIYEGDITTDWLGNPQIVEWEDVLGSCGCCWDEFKGCGFINTDGEVIGNIHQNPELLEVAK